MFSSCFPLKHDTKKSHQGRCSPLSSRLIFFPLQLVSQLACLWPVLATTLRFQSLAFSVTSSKGFLCAAPKSLQLIGRISNSFTMEHPANKRLKARRSWEVAISIFKAHNFYCTSSCAWSPFTSNFTVYKCSSLNWITHPGTKKTVQVQIFSSSEKAGFLPNYLSSINLHNSHHIGVSKNNGIPKSSIKK